LLKVRCLRAYGATGSRPWGNCIVNNAALSYVTVLAYATTAPHSIALF